jgi:hypothetical protein
MVTFDKSFSVIIFFFLAACPGMMFSSDSRNKKGKNARSVCYFRRFRFALISAGVLLLGMTGWFTPCLLVPPVFWHLCCESREAKIFHYGFTSFSAGRDWSFSSSYLLPAFFWPLW